MKNKNQYSKELNQLCEAVRALVTVGEYEQAMEIICKAFEHYPDAPHPHNLLGIVWEKKGNHEAAMKHFRASWALDPSYMPAKQNLESYGTFFSKGIFAFDESDVIDVRSNNIKVVYDQRGVGHMLEVLYEIL